MGEVERDGMRQNQICGLERIPGCVCGRGPESQPWRQIDKAGCWYLSPGEEMRKPRSLL